MTETQRGGKSAKQGHGERSAALLTWSKGRRWELRDESECKQLRLQHKSVLNNFILSSSPHISFISTEKFRIM